MTLNKILEKLSVINESRSYATMANDLEVSTQSVYRWMNGRSIPSPMAQEKLENYVSKFF